MSENAEVAKKELKVTARLLFDNKEVALVEKTLNVSENEKAEAKEDESAVRTIDETLTDLLNLVQDVANQNGYVVGKSTLANATMSLLVFIIKETEQEITLDIELEKPTEEKDTEKLPEEK